MSIYAVLCGLEWEGINTSTLLLFLLVYRFQYMESESSFASSGTNQILKNKTGRKCSTNIKVKNFVNDTVDMVSPVVLID